MKHIRFVRFFTPILILLVGVAGASAQVMRPYRVTDTQVRNLVSRIETKTDTYKRVMERVVDRSVWDGTRTEDNISAMITDFENATDRLRNSIGNRVAYNNEANEVLTRAAYINQFMARNRLNNNAQNQWASIRTDLNTLANYYSVSWNWNQTLPPYAGGVPFPSTGGYRVPAAQVRSLVSRIETKTDAFKRHMDVTFNRDRWDTTNADDNVSVIIADLENATDRLSSSLGSTSYNNEVNDVLLRASYIDRFMRNHRLNTAAESQWISLRTDLNTLATYYNVSWNWNQTLPPYVAGLPNGYPGTSRPGVDARLTGTYRLNRGLSDNVSSVVNRSINVYSTTERPNLGRNLERRLASPEMLVIEKAGRDVTIASSNAPQVTFSADGVPRSETNARGRTVNTTVTTSGQTVSINYQGDRDNDFYVTFAPDGNDRLRVTRRIYLPNRNQTITVASVYDKVDQVARWSDVNVNSYPGNTGTYDNSFVIPNGTRLTAVLRSVINTRATQVGDRFTLEVTSPNQYRGSIIEGQIANIDRSGRLSGRANVSIDFDTIRMPNGSTYRFEGMVDSIRTANGDTVSVNNEGVIRDNNQTTKTVTRAGIGAALGAIIGAIAGGGEGAAIGAAVGAGAGAGSVLIQGRDNMELGQGSEFSITSTSPAGTIYRQ